MRDRQLYELTALSVVPAWGGHRVRSVRTGNRSAFPAALLVTFTYEFLWDDVHVNVISHAPDEVDHTEHGSVCAVMYRHDTHTQTLMPLSGPATCGMGAALLRS